MRYTITSHTKTHAGFQRVEFITEEGKSYVLAIQPSEDDDERIERAIKDTLCKITKDNQND